MIGIPYLLSTGSKTALFKFSSTKEVESLFEDLGRADSNRRFLSLFLDHHVQAGAAGDNLDLDLDPLLVNLLL